MIQAEKLSQKLHNLRSKKEIKDFFIYFDEFRNFEINCTKGAISSHHAPSHLSENNEGTYVIVWNDDSISKGKMNSDSINSFDDFITNIKTTKIPYSEPVYIPERGIYPMVITYSKALADMIEVPEYLYKISDITVELDKMVQNNKGTSQIIVREGTRHAYSSKDLDEYYPYTQFSLKKTLGDISWELSTSDIFPLVRFQEILSFFGDIYNLTTEAKVKKVKTNIPVVLCPNIFNRLFQDQVINNLKAETILRGHSKFSLTDIENKLKCLGTLSLSYDPLLNHKLGTYRFTSYGVKPQRQYFIKFGKLNSVISDNFNYSLVNHSIPSIEVQSISNLKFEGIKKKSFEEVKRETESFVFAFNQKNYRKISNTRSDILTKNSLVFNNNKVSLLDPFDMSVDLLDLISQGKLEMIEFVDGQLGCKINP